MYILVVDPNAPLAMLLTQELKRLRYEVEQCETGEEALQIARERAPDLAMLDMALNDPDTTTLAKQLRELDANVRLTLTPFMGEQPVLSDDSIVVQGVLPKPFFLPELPARVEAILKAPLDGSAVFETPPEPEPEPEVIYEPEPAPVSTFPTAHEVKPAVRSEPAHEPELVTSVEQEEGLSYEAFTQNRAKVEQVMGTLAQEIGADAVLLTYGGGLLTWVGGLTQGEAESISRAVVHGWRTSAQVARILGREQVRFEQSIAGGDYILYALSVEVNAILAVAIRGSAALGLLRHRARSAVDNIARLCAV